MGSVASHTNEQRFVLFRNAKNGMDDLACILG